MKTPKMGVREPRNKTLIIRVSEKEHARVVEASRGARSLSEFLRELILQSTGGQRTSV